MQYFIVLFDKTVIYSRIDNETVVRQWAGQVDHNETELQFVQLQVIAVAVIAGYYCVFPRIHGTFL